MSGAALATDDIFLLAHACQLWLFPTEEARQTLAEDLASAAPGGSPERVQFLDAARAYVEAPSKDGLLRLEVAGRVWNRYRDDTPGAPCRRSPTSR
jgi:hypothetical protein